jgi:hypothetical protein
MKKFVADSMALSSKPLHNKGVFGTYTRCGRDVKLLVYIVLTLFLNFYKAQ